MPSSDAVFVDTSGWLALLNADDRLHARATKLLQQFGDLQRRLITTDWILAETGNGLARTKARVSFYQAVDTFQQSPRSRLVRINEELFRESLDLYHRVSDKTWGLVDCASFVVMRNENLMDALAADQHFRQAGFHCLLPMGP